MRWVPAPTDMCGGYVLLAPTTSPAQRSSNGGMNSGNPSGATRTIQPEEWISRWCIEQSITRFDSAVSPPSSHSWMWWISHQDGGRVQPGWAQPRSRAVTARRIPSGTVRAWRPTSNGWPTPSNTMGMTPASQHSRRSSVGWRVPPKVRQAAWARFCRSSSRISTFTWGRRPPVVGAAVVSPWAATHPKISAMASACRCSSGRRSSAVSGADLASMRAAIWSYMAASVNRPFSQPPPCGSLVRRSSLPSRGSRSSGRAPSWSSRLSSGAPQSRSTVGV